MWYNISIQILYEDDAICVVDKPAGVATHSASSWAGDDVVSLLRAKGAQIKTSGDEHRQGVVSRLDVGTSGLLVLAKHEDAYLDLKRQFSAHSVQKIYTALAKGVFKVKRGTVDAPIGRHPTKRALFSVVEGGKDARTHFDVESETEEVSLLRVHLETGRTHQIRVHLSTYGHPLVGDTMYGKTNALDVKSKLTRPFLHSTHLAFLHPETHEKMAFDSTLSDDLTRALEIFGII